MICSRLSLPTEPVGNRLRHSPPAAIPRRHCRGESLRGRYLPTDERGLENG